MGLIGVQLIGSSSSGHENFGHGSQDVRFLLMISFDRHFTQTQQHVLSCTIGNSLAPHGLLQTDSTTPDVVLFESLFQSISSRFRVTSAAELFLIPIRTGIGDRFASSCLWYCRTARPPIRSPSTSNVIQSVVP